jgi:hypothetical protein
MDVTVVGNKTYMRGVIENQQELEFLANINGTELWKAMTPANDGTTEEYFLVDSQIGEFVGYVEVKIGTYISVTFDSTDTRLRAYMARKTQEVETY